MWLSGTLPRTINGYMLQYVLFNPDDINYDHQETITVQSFRATMQEMSDQKKKCFFCTTLSTKFRAQVLPKARRMRFDEKQALRKTKSAISYR